MNKQNIALALTATGIILNIVTTIMVIVHAIQVIGFSRLMMMNELGLWVELFKANPAYALTVIGMSVVAFIIWFTGKVISQMVADEEAQKAKEWYKLSK